MFTKSILVKHLDLFSKQVYTVSVNKLAHLKEKIMKKKHVSRLSYAAGAFGNDVFYATLSTYFIVFVTTHLFNASDHKMIFIITNLIAAIRIGEVDRPLDR